MKVIHYRKKCIGCNACVEHAPEHWKISDEDGKVNLLGSKEKSGIFIKNIDAASEHEHRQAEKDCPMQIIKVVG